MRALAKKSEVGELRESVSELKSRVKSLEEKLKIAGGYYLGWEVAHYTARARSGRATE